MARAPVDFTNQFLIAMPSLRDGTFAGTVIYLCEHTEKGALGLVINKPIDIKLKNLFEKVDLSLDRPELAEAPVYFGGPVQTERGFVLHEALDGDEGEGGHYNSSLRIPGGLEMTTSKDVLEALSSGAGPKKVLVTLGYSGWGAGQLEDEMSRNGWINVGAERGFVLHEALDGDEGEGGHYNSSLRIPGGLEMTTSKDVLEALSSGAGPKKVLVTLGYSGWGAGQLEDEMSRNGWINVGAERGIIFDTPVEQRYDKALSLLGIDANMLSGEAGHA